MATLLEKATQNVKDVVTHAIRYTPPSKAMIVYDRGVELSTLLGEAYHLALPEAEWIDFNETTPNDLLAKMNALSPGDLVVLVQSGSFRLNEFRFRIELFKLGLAVIEHPHLRRTPTAEMETYINALAYDPAYYRTLGPKLKQMIDNAKQIVVTSENGSKLIYDAPFESVKLNIGDYTGMKNVGGQFPIGEVFTEPVDLATVNGEVELFAYGNAEFQVSMPETPVRLTIEKGLIVKTENVPAEFQAILDQIQLDEPLWVRELGFGMNKGLTRTERLTDIGSYERMCGIHMSLGQKHTVFGKPGFPKRTSRYHIDVFVNVKTVEIDGEVVYKENAYCV